MQFDSIGAFLAMGGHGAYVWSCWAIVLGCVLLGIITLKTQRTKTKQAISQHIAHTKARKQHKSRQ